MKNEHYIWADCCRVFAILGVIIIHTCAATRLPWGFLSMDSWLRIPNIADSFVRCSVPLFIMLSGALILDRYDKNYFFKNICRRLTRVVIPLFVWSCFYILCHYYFNGVEPVFMSMLTTPAKYHLWFIYMIIGIYIALPVLHSVYINIKENIQIQFYLFFIFIILSSLHVYCSSEIQQPFHIINSLGYASYFIIGAILKEHKFDNTPIFILFIMYISSCFLTAYITYKLSYSTSAIIETAYSNISPNIIVSSICLFIIIKKINIENPIFVQFIKTTSDLSFIVFFIHAFIIEKIVFFNQFREIIQHQRPSVILLTLAFLTITLSLCVAWIIRRIPFSSRIFG